MELGILFCIVFISIARRDGVKPESNNLAIKRVFGVPGRTPSHFTGYHLLARIYRNEYFSIDMLQPGWFYSSPVDFEHKNYLILDYLSKLDKSYSTLQLSPFLLLTQKLVDDMESFKESYISMEKALPRELIGFSWITGLKYAERERLKELDIILEIVDYSLPLLRSRIDLGYKLNDRYPQFLF